MSTKIAQVQLQQRRGVYLWLFKKIHIGTYNATQYKHAHALAGMLRGGARAPNDRPVGVNQVGKVELGRGSEGRRGRAPTSRAVIIRRTTPRSPKPDPKYFFYKSPMSSFNTYYNAANLEGIITLFKEAPGLLFRYARCTLARLQSHGSVAIEEFSNILPPLFHLLKSNQIVELLHIMKHATQLHQYEVVYRVKNSSFYYPEVKKDQQIECAKKKNKNISTTIATSTTAPVIAAPASATAKVPSAELCNNVCSLLSKELDTRRHTPTMKTVLWIQDDVPWSTMHISKGRDKGVPAWVSSTCATGDVVKVDDDARVILFMHWMQSIDQTIDLDLSCVFYNEKGYTIGKSMKTTIPSND